MVGKRGEEEEGTGTVKEEDGMGTDKQWGEVVGTERRGKGVGREDIGERWSTEVGFGEWEREVIVVLDRPVEGTERRVKGCEKKGGRKGRVRGVRRGFGGLRRGRRG